MQNLLYFLSVILLDIAFLWLAIFVYKKCKFYDSIFEQAKIYYNKNLNKGDKKND